MRKRNILNTLIHLASLFPWISAFTTPPAHVLGLGGALPRRSRHAVNLNAIKPGFFSGRSLWQVYGGTPPQPPPLPPDPEPDTMIAALVDPDSTNNLFEAVRHLPTEATATIEVAAAAAGVVVLGYTLRASIASQTQPGIGKTQINIPDGTILDSTQFVVDKFETLVVSGDVTTCRLQAGPTVDIVVSKTGR